MKVGFALVGCGRIAKRHADLLGNHQINNGDIIAVCDIKPERARSLGEKFKVPWFTNMHQMMHEIEEKVHAITILTESGNHAKHVIELARYKKHIIVEKPMALTLDDADAMIKACDENSVKLFVVKQNRFNLPVMKLKQALDAGRFGKLVLGTVRVRWCRTQEYYNQDSWRGTWALDGGVLSNQASHHIDLLEWMMGTVESVYAKSSTALAKIEAEDTAVVTLKFSNGALGVIEATTAARPKDLEGSLSILGEKGTVEIGGFAVNQIKIWNFISEVAEDKVIMERFSVNPPNVYGFGHKEYLNHAVECIQKGNAALVDGLEGRKSLELITAIYESIETGQEISLRFRPNKCRLGISS